MDTIIAIEEINANINNAVNVNNANTHAYNANTYAKNANTYAYGARTNANACNQILSNVYYNNGDTKKSWHFYDTNSTLNLTNVNGILYTLSTNEANIEVQLDNNTTYVTQRQNLVLNWDYTSNGLSAFELRAWANDYWLDGSNKANTNVNRISFVGAFSALQFNYVLNIRFSNLVTNGVVRATYSLYE